MISVVSLTVCASTSFSSCTLDMSTNLFALLYITMYLYQCTTINWMNNIKSVAAMVKSNILWFKFRVSPELPPDFRAERLYQVLIRKPTLIKYRSECSSLYNYQFLHHYNNWDNLSEIFEQNGQAIMIFLAKLAAQKLRNLQTN